MRFALRGFRDGHGMGLIEIKALGKSYETGGEQVHALVDVTLHIERGQFIPYLTVVENVMLPLSITDTSNQEQRRIADDILERTGLRGKGGRLPDQLSGGGQERVAIDRALG